MKNLDKLKSDRLAAKRHNDQLTAYMQLEQAVRGLQEQLERQQVPDYSELVSVLDEVKQTLDFTPLIRSLEESINQTSTSHKSLIKTNTDGYSKLTKAIKDNKPVITQKNVKVVTNDVAAEYRVSNVEPGDSYSYYGYLHPSGKWYILRQNGSSIASFTYATGLKEYLSSWQKKENLTYKLYDEVRL